MATLEELASAVASREAFLAFVDALAADRARDAAKEALQPSNPYGPTAGGWENTSVEAFLESAVACARDGHLFSTEPSWRDMAFFLLGGKSYE